MYFVYVLQSVEEPDNHYTGYTSDLKKRIASHNAGESRYTRGRRWRLVYYEAYVSEAIARDRERKLKHDGRVKRFLMERIKTQYK